jgi:hypothetical protein
VARRASSWSGQEEERAGARALHPVDEPAVLARGEPVEGEGWADGITAEALQALAVVRVDPDARMTDADGEYPGGVQTLPAARLGIHSASGGARVRDLATADPEVFDLVQSEQRYQRDTICLIASENYLSPAVLVSPDPVDFPARVPAPDPLGELALRAARLERHLGLRAVARLRIPVVDWRVSEPLHPLVREALRPGRGRPGARGGSGVA